MKLLIDLVDVSIRYCGYSHFNIAERVIETQGKGGLEGEKASFLQKAREGIHDFSDRISKPRANFP